MSDGAGIPRIQDIGQAEFEESYLRPGRPVVLSFQKDGWKPPAWTPEDLVARVGGTRVQVASCPHGVFQYGPDALRTLDVEELSLREAAAAICAMEGTRAMYLMQQPVVKVFPELCSEISVPPLLSDEAAAPHLWFGGAGNVTQLHYDPLTNCFVQVYGRKRFTLYAPQCFEELYPHPVDSPVSHLSQIDAERPDPRRHPRAVGLPRFEVVLEPGDMLFLPAFWWHHVRSLGTSISLNFWTVPPVSHCAVPASLRLLSAMYKRDRLATIGAPFRNARTGFLGPADEMRAAGMRWPAVLLAAAAIELTVRQLCLQAGVAYEDTTGPRALAILNGELAERGVYSAEYARVISELDSAFEHARQAHEDLLTDTDVSRVLNTVAWLLA